LKSRFAEPPVIPTANNYMISFWHLLQESELKHLRSTCIDRRYVCRFRCIYKCLHSFPAMTLIKDKKCSCLTDFHLNGHMI